MYMKNYNKAAWLRSFAAFCLMIAVFVSSSMIALAKPGSSLAGEIIVTGHNSDGVMLNGERAFSGRTFFDSGVISTTDTSATVKLGKLGYVTVAPNSSVSLAFTEKTISGKVLAGEVKVFNNEGVTVNLENAAKKAQDDDDDDDNSATIPLIIFAGIVGGAIIWVLTNDDDDDVVSAVR